MGETEVTSVEIARMAGVGRAAVSNWRRRYDDFPQPVDGTTTNPRFHLTEVEAWLRRQGKLSALPAEELVWQHLRAMPAAHDLPDAVRRAGELLIPEPTDPPPGEKPDSSLRAALAALVAERGPGEAFELLLRRLHDAARLPQVPAELADLMAALAGPEPATIYAPACGTGSLALSAAGRFPRVRVHAEEADPTLRGLAQLRLAVHQHPRVELHAGGLRHPPVPALDADAVLCAPPAADRDWDPTADDLAYDPRWAYGVPPRAEPELAWAQHALANLRPGGRAVLLLPPAVAARPSGRRVRAELLRRGALRAVIGLPAGATPPHNLALQLWVLRRPGPDDTADSVLMADAAGGGGGGGAGGGGEFDAAGRRWSAALVAALAALDRGDDPPATPELAIRAFRVMDLLDDAVDLAPGRRLHIEPAPVDPSLVVRRRDELAQTLDRLRGLLPAIAAVPHPPARSMITIGDLARTRAVSLISARGAGRDGGDAGQTGAGTVPVWQVRDVLAGGGPTGRLATEAVPGDAVRVEVGDVVAPVIGPELVARVVIGGEAGAVLGPSLSLLRPDPALLDPWFLAGFLSRASNRHRAGSLGSVTRYDLRRAEVPRIPLPEQRAYGELFQQLAEYGAVLNAVVAGSSDLVGHITDSLAAGALRA